MSAAILAFPGSAAVQAAQPQEQFVARLATAAYQAALEAGLTGPFIEAQLSIWAQVRRIVETHRQPHVELAPAPYEDESPRRIVFVRAARR